MSLIHRSMSLIRSPPKPMMCGLPKGDPDRYARPLLIRAAFRLEWFTVGWMIVEALVALAEGVVARSVSLIAFGLDSLIELTSACVLIWRLNVELRRGQSGAEMVDSHGKPHRRSTAVCARGLHSGGGGMESIDAPRCGIPLVGPAALKGGHQSGCVLLLCGLLWSYRRTDDRAGELLRLLSGPTRLRVCSPLSRSRLPSVKSRCERNSRVGWQVISCACCGPVAFRAPRATASR